MHFSLKKFHHHTELSIVLKMNLDCCGITVFVVVSDNAANMKSAFTMELDQGLNPDTQSDVSDDFDENEDNDPFIVLSH